MCLPPDSASSLPYAIRLRQCVVEYIGSGGLSQRPMYNAVKYATAFPVIFLSAAQRLLNADDDDTGRTWYGEHAIFRLWFVTFPLLILKLFAYSTTFCFNATPIHRLVYKGSLQSL